VNYETSRIRWALGPLNFDCRQWVQAHTIKKATNPLDQKKHPTGQDPQQRTPVESLSRACVSSEPSPPSTGTHEIVWSKPISLPSQLPKARHDMMHYSPSYTLQPSPPPSESIARSSPSPPPANSGLHLPPLPIPPSFNNHKNSFSRQGYPTSSPHPPQQSSPEPSPGSKIRLPPPTSLFTNGYASPAMST
jgi:hypothetical protein